MPSPVIDQVLDSVVATVTALGLTAGAPPAAIPVAKRKLPTREEAVDPSTLICVSLAQELPRPARFSVGTLLYLLPVEVTLVTPSPGDTAASLPVLSDFYGTIRDAFAATSKVKGSLPVSIPAGPAKVWKVRPGAGVFVDRPKLNQMMDYQAQVVNVWLLAPTR